MQRYVWEDKCAACGNRKLQVYLGVLFSQKSDRSIDFIVGLTNDRVTSLKAKMMVGAGIKRLL
jgi:hypothetical protein